MGTLRFFKQAFFCQDVHHFVHLIVIEGFSVITIKGNPKFVVKAVKFNKAFVTEPLPKSSSFFVACLQFTEPFACFFV